MSFIIRICSFQQKAFVVIIVLLKNVTRFMLRASPSTLLCRGDVLQRVYSVDLFCGCCCFAFLQEALVTFNMSEGQHSNLHQLPADSCESRRTVIETKVKLIEMLVAQGLCSSLVGYCDDYFHNSCVRCKRLIQKLTNVCYQLRHPVEYDTLSRLAENFIVLYSTKTIRI